MEIRSDLAPPVASPGSSPVQPEPLDEGGPERSKFSQMLAEVEMHRNRVRFTLWFALLARLLFEFSFVSVFKSQANLLVQVPYIGLAIVSYLMVLMWLAARTRDRFGFGMALGIGVLEATYLFVVAAMYRPFSIAATWAPIIVAVAHVPMAVFAFQASRAYPPLDSKRPWLIGFITALIFLSIPWVAPSVLEAMK